MKSKHITIAGEIYSIALYIKNKFERAPQNEAITIITNIFSEISQMDTKNIIDKLCKDFNILKIFQIVESSTRGNRKEFHIMLNFIQKQKEKIALVCDKVDRLQRTFNE